jgi:hypothetical protein
MVYPQLQVVEHFVRVFWNLLDRSALDQARAVNYEPCFPLSSLDDLQ